MKIYISGSMTMCIDKYKKLFSKKAEQLESEGHIVINPATLPIGLDNEKYMPICLAMIDGAEAVYLFNDWEKSKGALLEKAYAEYQNKKVIIENDKKTMEK